MDLTLGKLRFLPAAEHPDLVARRVAESLALRPNTAVGVAEIDPALSDTAAFCEHYELAPEQAANCVVLEAKRSDRNWFAACVILGTTKADVNGLARKTLEARKISFAPMDTAVALSEMEYGAITPVGLPGDWPILIDGAVAASGFVIVGSGIRKSKLAVRGSWLAALPNAQVLEGLGMSR